MGKNISVYLNDDLLGLVEASGVPASRVVQEALKKYFQPESQAKAVKGVIEAALTIGQSGALENAVAELYEDRELDRW